MIYFNIACIMFFCLLALLSKKHYSKYKNIFDAIAFSIYEIIGVHLNKQKTKRNIRKINVSSNLAIDEMVNFHYVKIISICLMVFIGANLLSAVTEVYGRINPAADENNISRGAYDADLDMYNIHVENESEEYDFTLDVAPLSLDKAEFDEKSKEIMDDLKSAILGNNTDLLHVENDLSLPETDETGVFHIVWETDSPEYIMPDGEICNETLKEDAKVKLKATISYEDFSTCCDYDLVICPRTLMDDERSRIENEIKKVEAETRYDSEFSLPKKINDSSISIGNKGIKVSYEILVFGILICSMIVLWFNSNLSNRCKERDNLLKQAYPSLVNKLWLLLGTGMTIRSCFIKIIDESEESNILVREIEYAVNQMNSGFDEATVYEELGTRLGLKCYISLMSHISQNIKMGTRDLRNLMSEELIEANEMKKEYVKKKGEEASTKLLFPMILMLAVVMLIVIIPAFVSF